MIKLEAAIQSQEKDQQRKLKFSNPPSYASELAFVMTNLLFLKILVDDQYFTAMTFFKICIPLLCTIIGNILMNLLELLQLIHIESLAPDPEQEDNDLMVSPKQLKLLVRIIRDLSFYFGIYTFTSHVDLLFTFNEQVFDAFQKDKRVYPSALMIEVALFLQIYIVTTKRQRINNAKVKAGILSQEEADQSYIFAGLTTFFNAITQTTTTLCANGQCFTIYSNAIASNLAAFGVTVTQLSVILVPLCLILLGYTVWSLYRQKKDLMYQPFQLGSAGAILIVLDNFIIGHFINMYNIPSYLGNIALITASIWAARDTSQEKVPMFKKKKRPIKQNIETQEPKSTSTQYVIDNDEINNDEQL